MPLPSDQREILRRLAERVAELADEPIQAQRTSLWKRHNALQPTRALVQVSCEGGWSELVPEISLRCTDPPWRGIERDLRQRIFQQEQIGDDTPITTRLAVPWQVAGLGAYGLQHTEHRTDAKGAANWDAPIRSAADLDRLHLPDLSVDRDASLTRHDEVADLFEGLLEVELASSPGWTVGLTQMAIRLRGLLQVMMDVYDEPQLLHDLMAFLRDARAAEIDFLEAEGLLGMNNHPDSLVGSGGLGASDELPAPKTDGPVRLADLWGLAESQEFSEVGPDQFAEFALAYQVPLINRFGLACYGCCEALDAKFDSILQQIPRLRRVSVSPWCDREIAADKLTGRCIFSYKPNPALVCAPQPTWDEAEQALRDTLAIARGCRVEMILKDTHTFCSDPSRPGRWAEMALRVSREVAGADA